MPTRIVCAGDSNTRGQLCVSYVQMLSKHLSGRDATVSAAGVNGDCSYNLRQRLDPIVAQRPDAVTVLIGTNDAWSTLSPVNARKMVKRKKLPAAPTLTSYRENLTAIVDRLSAETDAQIALVSPPVLGQDLNSPAAQASAEFSEIVKTIAAEHRLAYLPLHERQSEYLMSGDVESLKFPDGLVERGTSVLQHFVLRRPYDSIARGRRLALTSDFVHQNSRGASMIADLITDFLTRSGAVANLH